MSPWAIRTARAGPPRRGTEMPQELRLGFSLRPSHCKRSAGTGGWAMLALVLCIFTVPAASDSPPFACVASAAAATLAWWAFFRRDLGERVGWFGILVHWASSVWVWVATVVTTVAMLGTTAGLLREAGAL